MKINKDGILIVNKEKDYTSRDVINVLNKKFNMKKIGHTGTLDPLATGVLVVCLGKYTKLVSKITALDKEYTATIKLGIKTDTLDITGNILEKSGLVSVSDEEVIKVLNSFLGESIQEVPLYAAVKVNGKKLYEYARNGEEVILPKRNIFISDIKLLENKEGTIKFSCVVSKGTYIRSLIKDICAKLNVIGTMSSLERTRQGIFLLKDAYSIDMINNDNYKLLNVYDIFPFYKAYDLNNEEYKKVKNGNYLKLKNDDSFLIMKYNDEIVAVYENINGVFKPYFML